MGDFNIDIKKERSLAYNKLEEFCDTFYLFFCNIFFFLLFKIIYNKKPIF